MKKEINKLIVIPARGGSKGIPRKNLRPIAGKPLIYYSIAASLKYSPEARVVVSTEDDEIALLGRRFGADVLIRDEELADDKTTLDPVICSVVKKAEAAYNETYDIIITVQPTSPLINPDDIRGVVHKVEQEGYDTSLTVVDDRHLCWSIENGIAVPAYEERVNRQQLPLKFKETGAVVACSREQLEQGSRIGSNVGIYEVPHERSFDIDTFSDLALCESILQRKRVVFSVVGYPEVGLGHAYRSVMLANEFVEFDIVFVCERRSELAAEYIKSNNYHVIFSDDGDDNLAETIIELKPELVINDILDTNIEFINRLKQEELKVVNFEDMGNGAGKADLVINALYPHQLPKNGLLTGHKYFCLRDEFIFIGEREPRKEVKQVLITFGGVDEGNITLLVLKKLAPLCEKHDISLEVVTGPGYCHQAELEEFIHQYKSLNCKLVRSTKKISEHMINADLAFTSGGRTVLELSALQVPTIVICQNERETTHTFASSENGIVNLGHREHLNEEEIQDVFERIVLDDALRHLMRTKMANLNLRKGKNRVISKIKSLLN